MDVSHFSTDLGDLEPISDDGLISDPHFCSDNFTDAVHKEQEYLLYWIYDGVSDRYYIGISREPEVRIRNHLNNSRNSASKAELNANYLATVEDDIDKPMEQRRVQFGYIARPHDIGPHSYENVLVACVTEFLFMQHLEDRLGKSIYNENYKGGHNDLRERRPAFHAIVKILKPSLKEVPTREEIEALERFAPELKEFIDMTGGKEILGAETFEKIRDGYHAHLDQKRDAFGETPIGRRIKTLKGHELRPMDFDTPSPKFDPTGEDCDKGKPEIEAA